MTETQKPQEGFTTVPCWKCGGTGHYAHGVCYGCMGSGTNTYTTAVWKRMQAAAKGRATKAAAAWVKVQQERTGRFAAMSIEDIMEEVPSMLTVEDGAVEIWADDTHTATKWIEVYEYAVGLHNGIY